MDDKTQTRSSRSGITGDVDLVKGVGARHKDLDAPTEGGGYLDTCSDSDLALLKKIAPPGDPRLNMLHELGLADHWLKIADLVGFDHFMTMWMILDEPNVYASSRERKRRRIHVPQYSKFMRFCREKIIIDLSNKGKKPHLIHKILLKDMRERVSVRHIERIIKNSNIDK